jgi:hypothetical protein
VYTTESRSAYPDPHSLHPPARRREPVITHKNFHRALEPRPINGPARGCVKKKKKKKKKKKSGRDLTSSARVFSVTPR